MSEVIAGYGKIFTSFINFLFTLEFSDGTSAGGIILATCVFSLLIRYIMKVLRAGPGFSVTQVRQAEESAAVKSIHSVMTRGD